MKISKHKKIKSKDFYIVKDSNKGNVYLMLERENNDYALWVAKKAFKDKKELKRYAKLWNKIKYEFA